MEWATGGVTEVLSSLLYVQTMRALQVFYEDNVPNWFIMKQLIFFTFALTCSCIAFCTPVEQNPLDLELSGVLKTIRGHTVGYIPPKEGTRIHLRFDEIEKISKLSFLPTESSKEDVSLAYIPLPKNLEIIELESNGPSNFNSLRAISRTSHHKVTLDIIRKPGSGRKDSAIAWVLIEANGRIVGVLEINGETRSISKSK